MRIRVELDDRLLADVDRLAGPRGRSAFVHDAIELAVRQAQRWRDIESAAGAIDDRSHEWDDDPAAWVREQRRSDPRRTV